IFVGNFLERSLCSQIERALRPEGLLFYQTWVVDKVSEEGPANPDYLLAENELLRLFPNLRVRYFRDEGRLGDLDQGNRNHAMLIAQRDSMKRV
ncbi:MAG: SAM-dependent methyltransferase, partial [Gammaproteobacteria bacterium]|nr:SAM-dependent methyltransferase [Gammaproteobacteria bacterium]